STEEKGGGIENYGTLNLLGGSICENVSYDVGAGIYNSANGYILIDGGEISSNKTGYNYELSDDP
ncbi:MAG TPA: hypothetical protein DCG49_12000, partial [Ruminococcus sp.]|nr:hypothetical protein [Ruminococcus sp.]